MLEFESIICNKLGLHTRASSTLVNLSIKYASEITLSVIDSGLTANCKSIMGLMMLAAKCGTNIKICVSGEDELQASKAIKLWIENKFGEEE